MYSPLFLLVALHEAPRDHADTEEESDEVGIEAVESEMKALEQSEEQQNNEKMIAEGEEETETSVWSVFFSCMLYRSFEFSFLSFSFSWIFFMWVFLGFENFVPWIFAHFKLVH